MALKIKYNKTFSQDLSRQLTIRERALPTLKSKETALRVEVKKAMDLVAQLAKTYDLSYEKFLKNGALLKEFPYVLRIDKTEEETKNIAGVKVKVLKEISFKTGPIFYYQQPAWIPTGIEMLKEIIVNKLRLKYSQKQLETLNYHRKKTTQKVNLYEKVQIPDFKEGILRIKRYLEDEENLQKAAQKIVKERHLQEDEVT